MDKISIIVPVYNVEKFIDKSINSLINQTFKNLEIILVNDGSTDRSLEICRRYESIDSRIIVIDKENSGVSDTRNQGLEFATGNFITFIDPDDWIELDMYEKMYNTMKETDSDVVMCNYYEEYNTTSIERYIPINKNVLNKNEIINEIIANMISSKDLENTDDTIMGSVWRLLIKSNIIYNNNIEFQKDIPLMEDLIFTINVFLNSEKIAIDKGIYYHYRQNNQSAIYKYREDLKSIHDKVSLEIKKIISKYNLYKLLENRFEIRYASDVIASIISECHPNNKYKKYNEKIKGINNICSDLKFRNILKNSDISKYNLKRKILLTLIIKNKSKLLFLYFNTTMKLKQTSR